MVKSRRIAPACRAMLRASWLLFHFLTALVLLCSAPSAHCDTKISDVAGEEGAIDGLEALLDAPDGGLHPFHRTPTRRGHQPLGGDVANVASVGRSKGLSSESLSAASGARAETGPIQFGVGPRDPRYFDQIPSQVRANTLQTRSQGPLRALERQDPDLYLGPRVDLTRSDLLKLRNGYSAPYSNSGVAGPDLGVAQFGDPNPHFSGADARQLDAYDQFLGDLSDQYDSAFADLVSNRLSGYDQQQDPRSEAFLARLRDVLRSGDKDSAQRMLGLQGPHGAPGSQHGLGLGDLQRLKATSQPEFVHFNHQRQPHNRQVQPLSSDSTNKATATTKSPETSQDPKGDYNPNDPSSNVNTESKTNSSETAHGGTQVAGLPQHLSQSQHSASASQAVVQSSGDQGGFSDVYFTAMVAGCTAAAVCFLIGTGVCWYRLNKKQRAAKDTDYPAYGVTGPSRELSPGAGPGGDRNLAHSAHMYHYQQQKNQMIALDKSGGGDTAPGGGGASDVDSEEEDDGDDRDYTVYECPGLAPMGEMVVPNPMYPPEDATPASPSLKEDNAGRGDRE